jgi:hypothetical protein
MGEGSYMTENIYWQSAALFWAAVCFFRVGAMTKGIAMNRRTWLEIAQAAVIVVALFALITDGRGCSAAGSSSLEPAACVGDAQC